MDFASLALGEGEVATVPPPSTNGASKNGAGPDERKGVSLDWVGDMSAGRVVYLNSAVPGEVEEVRRATAYAAAAYCYAAIRYRAEQISEPPLRVVQDGADGDEALPDHPVSKLLADPSPDHDGGELVELTQTYWDIDGDALWAKDANLLGSTGRLTPFTGSEYSVEQTADRIRGRFRLSTARGPKPLQAEDVVYFAYPNPGDRQRGLSPTDVAIAMLNLGQRTQATIRGLLKNAVFPSIVVATHPDWKPTEDELEWYRQEIESHAAGPANAGKPFVALGGSKVERVSFNLQEVLPGELLDRVEATVASVYRIPPIVLGYLVGLKNSPWSQMEQAHRQAYHDAIEPQWRRIEKALTRQLLRPVDPDPNRRIAFDRSSVLALQDDESAKVKDAKDATWWTVDERRRWTGQEPLGGKRGEHVELLDSRAGAGPRSADASPNADPGKGADGARSRPETKADERTELDAKWERFDLLAKAQEETWATACLAQLRRDRKAVLELFDDTVGKTDGAHETKEPPTADPELIAGLVRALAEKLDMGPGWEETTTPLIRSTGRTALKVLAAELDIAFSVLEPTLLEYTRAEAAFLVKNIPATTRDRIAAELKAGLAEGESIPALRERIQDAWAFSRERAELIARTETTRVTNGAQRQSMSDYQASDDEVVVEKAWLSARDARVRDAHQELDKDGDESGWIGVDNAFENGLDAPGEPNCRCTLIYRIRDAA